MNHETSSWNFGLLFGSMCVLLGIIGVVTARQNAQRQLASGLFTQGVILIFVVAGADFYGSANLNLSALAVAALLVIQTCLRPGFVVEENARREDDSK